MPITTRDVSSKQEKFLEKYLGVYRTANSGASIRKGDLQDMLSVFEAKTTMTPKKSYSVKKEELEKLKKETIGEGKEFSTLFFDFGTPIEKETYAVVPLAQFKKLYDLYKAATLEED